MVVYAHIDTVIDGKVDFRPQTVAERQLYRLWRIQTTKQRGHRTLWLRAGRHQCPQEEHQCGAKQTVSLRLKCPQQERNILIYIKKRTSLFQQFATFPTACPKSANTHPMARHTESRKYTTFSVTRPLQPKCTRIFWIGKTEHQGKTRPKKKKGTRQTAKVSLNQRASCRTRTNDRSRYKSVALQG